MMMGFTEAYATLCRDILDQGELKDDRTGVRVLSVFGRQFRIDLQDGFPLLTLRRVPWKHVVEELLWFLRGDTDSKILERKGVTIWKGNTSREFLDRQGLVQYDEGVLGPGYGWQIRFFGAQYDSALADTSKGVPVGGFDQLDYMINEIKTNRASRRIMMCYWNPCDFRKVALPPCHYACQFYVRDNQYLDCMFSMRSTDVALGLPFNVASYAVLTMIVAKRTALEPGHLVYTGGDVHMYTSHVDTMQEILQRDGSVIPLPLLELDDAVATKPIEELSVDDFRLSGYTPYPVVRMEMAV